MGKLSAPAKGDEYVDPAIIQLLQHRYGDGLVYLRDAAERGLYDLAVAMGLINSEGYLTPEGRSVLARCATD